MPEHHLRSFTCLKSLLAFALMAALTAPTIVYAAPPTPDALPAALDAPNDSLPGAINNTPEYVIIKPSDQVTYSSETAASIDQLNVHEGSHFKVGDILLKMDCRLQVAELKKAQAQSTTATTANASAEKLKAYGAISELEVIKSESDAKIAKAEVDKLTAVVDKCVIKAPFNGAVAEVMVHALESVKPGDPLLKIMNTENLEFEIEVPSNWLNWLKLNSTFYVYLNEIKKQVEVKVIRIDPEIESVSQTIKITGIITKPDPNLLPGMSGQAFFPDNPENAKGNKTKSMG